MIVSSKEFGMFAKFTDLTLLEEIGVGILEGIKNELETCKSPRLIGRFGAFYEANLTKN